MPATLEILKAGRALIENPAHWTQRAFAIDCGGVDVGASSPNACSWCSIGALLKAGNHDPLTPGRRHLEQAIEQILGFAMDLDDFNDTHTHSEVLQVWDKAIENADSR